MERSKTSYSRPQASSIRRSRDRGWQGMLEQHLEQRKLTGGEEGFLAVADQDAAAQLHDLAEAHVLVIGCRCSWRRLWLAAQHGVDAGNQFARLNGLGR